MAKRPQKTEASGLQEIVSSIIETRRDTQKISPAWVATEAMGRLKAVGLRKTKPLVYIGCHLQLRQIARDVCRSLFEGTTDQIEVTQHPLFPGLQSHYPAAHNKGDERQYVREDLMDLFDYTYNIERLRREGNAKLAHADLLEARMQDRFGKVAEAG